MALSREDIQSMLDNAEMSNSEKAAWLLDKHLDTVNGLKSEVADYKIKLGNAQKELDGVKQNGNGYKEKYDKEHSDFEKFKAEIAAKETRESKGKAFLSILNLANIKGANADFVMDSKTAEKMIDELEIKDGKVVNQEDVLKAVTEKWGNYAERKEVFNAPVPNPPINTGGTAKTKEQIMAIKDGTARRKAIAENLSLFGANPSNSNE